jgi:predicted enzyme related to lactoylglutathione lyase
MTNPSIGKIVWTDLTVPDAAPIRDFYSALLGWQPSEVNMGDYDDFSMIPAGGTDAVTGICHARGSNAGMPAQWMIYIRVANLDASIALCNAAGGQVVNGPRDMGGGSRFCIIRDPAGAVCGLMEMADA